MVTTHVYSSVLPCRSRVMVGSEVPTIVWSRAERNIPSRIANRICILRRCGRSSAGSLADPLLGGGRGFHECGRGSFQAPPRRAGRCLAVGECRRDPGGRPRGPVPVPTRGRRHGRLRPAPPRGGAAALDEVRPSPRTARCPRRSRGPGQVDGPGHPGPAPRVHAAPSDRRSLSGSTGTRRPAPRADSWSAARGSPGA